MDSKICSLLCKGKIRRVPLKLSFGRPVEQMETTFQMPIIYVRSRFVSPFLFSLGILSILGLFSLDFLCVSVFSLGPDTVGLEFLE